MVTEHQLAKPVTTQPKGRSQKQDLFILFAEEFRKTAEVYLLIFGLRLDFHPHSETPS